MALIARLVKHCTGNAKIVGSKPIQRLNFSIIFRSRIMAVFAYFILSQLCALICKYDTITWFSLSHFKCSLLSKLGTIQMSDAKSGALAARRAAKRISKIIETGLHVCIETRTNAAFFLLSKWLAAWITGTCA